MGLKRVGHNGATEHEQANSRSSILEESHLTTGITLGDTEGISAGQFVPPSAELQINTETHMGGSAAGRGQFPLAGSVWRLLASF